MAPHLHTPSNRGREKATGDLLAVRPKRPTSRMKGERVVGERRVSKSVDAYVARGVEARETPRTRRKTFVEQEPLALVDRACPTVARADDCSGAVSGDRVRDDDAWVERIAAIAEAVATRIIEKQRKPVYTLGEIAGMYLARMMKRVENPSDIEIPWRLRLSVLGGETEETLTPEKIEARLEETCDSARTWNKTRGVGLRLVEAGRDDGKWSASNPFSKIEVRDEEKRDVRILTPAEIGRTMEVSSPSFGAKIATGYLTGRRKDDLHKLERTSLDFPRKLVTWRKTKNGRTYVVPLHDQLIPILQRHLATHDDRFVFPRARGGQVDSNNLKLAAQFRRALGRAGIVERYDMICRRKGCGYREQRPNAKVRYCDRCDFKLWPSAVPVPLRFHDIRHMTTTALLELDVPRAIVKEYIGHAVGDVTDFYAHHSHEFIRGHINRLRLPEPAGG